MKKLKKPLIAVALLIIVFILVAPLRKNLGRCISDIEVQLTLFGQAPGGLTYDGPSIQPIKVAIAKTDILPGQTVSSENIEIETLQLTPYEINKETCPYPKDVLGAKAKLLILAGSRFTMANISNKYFSNRMGKGKWVHPLQLKKKRRNATDNKKLEEDNEKS